MNATGNDAGAPSPSRRGSLFFKLLAILLGAFLAMLLGLGFFFRSLWNPETHDTTARNLRHYAELLTEEIGTPPDFEKAARISDELRLGIAVRDTSGAWWFSPLVPAALRERALSMSEPDSANASLRRGGRMLAVIPREGRLFVYGSRRRQPIEIRNEDWFILLGSILAVGATTWFLLRRQLYPVRMLARGVKAVEQGNLDAHVSEAGSNEFSGLARSFNAMTMSLKERLRARDQLLLDVSHELRTPLTRMRVALEMAEPGTAVDSLREEVDSLGKMVSEILESERLNGLAGGLQKEPSDLNALVTAEAARFEGAEPGVRLSLKPLPSVPMDAERMRVVARNLLDNALKHGHGAARPVEAATRREDGEAVLEVRNDGPVVPEEEQRLVFEPFYRTDRSRSGTSGYGLGLPLCKRIVEAHGGSIGFRSRSGEGTTVTVRLPLS